MKSFKLFLVGVLVFTGMSFATPPVVKGEGFLGGLILGRLLSGNRGSLISINSNRGFSNRGFNNGFNRTQIVQDRFGNRFLVDQFGRTQLISRGFNNRNFNNFNSFNSRGFNSFGRSRGVGIRLFR